MTRGEMWKEFENQLISETRTPITMSYDDAEILIKLGIKETVAKWKKRLEQTRWIPVSERLPEHNGDYLVTFKLLFTYPVEVCYYDGQAWDKEQYDAVLAWMPLPEIYKGESEDAE